ncbi:MAG: DsbA family protein [Robiginitomaculum sp.]|nr:DsbA family protein [Robiginitomaculum sp.]
MTFNIPTDSLVKTALMTVVAATLLVACGDKSSAPKTSAVATTSIQGRTAYETQSDHALGSVDAPITIVEYASVTCPHCATWSLSVFPEIQEKLIATGKVRYVFREFPTPPVDLANAGHLLANCAPEEKFFDLLHIQFKRQAQIRGSRDIKGEFIKLAKSAGMSEADFDACMVNQTEIDHLQSVIVAGSNAGVTFTPTFFINGKKTPKDTFTYASIEKLIAETLGEPIPETSEDMDSGANKDTGH